jgi:hypothetical protein
MFNFVGVGIRKASAETLTKSHFESGFLARMLWSVADPRPRQEGSEDLEYADEMTAADRAMFDAEIVELLHPFFNNIGSSPSRLHRRFVIDAAAQKRYNKWAEEGMRLAESYGDDGILVPSFQRMKTSIIKAASLLAMHDGTTTATLKHLLPTLAQAELWFSDMVRMAAEVSSSDFERKCDDLEGFIKAGKDSKQLEANIRRRFGKYKPNEFDEIVRALQAQGRVRRDLNDRQKLEAL